MQTVNIKDINFNKMLLFCSEGKESNLYTDFNSAYKIYKNPDIDMDIKDKKISILSSINLPGILRPKVRIVENGFIGFGMDFIDGKPLTQINLTKEEIIKIFKRLSNILKYCHKYGIILSDINLSNILMKTVDEIYFCDSDSCRIYDYENDSIPMITYKYLINHELSMLKTDVDEQFDKLSLYLNFLYLIFDKKDIFNMTVEESDNLIEIAGLESQKKLINKLQKEYVEVPYVGDLL